MKTTENILVAIHSFFFLKEKVVVNVFSEVLTQLELIKVCGKAFFFAIRTTSAPQFNPIGQK